jgi:hypothetical protein
MTGRTAKAPRSKGAQEDKVRRDDENENRKPQIIKPRNPIKLI